MTPSQKRIFFQSSALLDERLSLDQGSSSSPRKRLIFSNPALPDRGGFPTAVPSRVAPIEQAGDPRTDLPLQEPSNEKLADCIRLLHGAGAPPNKNALSQEKRDEPACVPEPQTPSRLRAVLRRAGALNSGVGECCGSMLELSQRGGGPRPADGAEWDRRWNEGLGLAAQCRSMVRSEAGPETSHVTAGLHHGKPTLEEVCACRPPCQNGAAGPQGLRVHAASATSSAVASQLAGTEQAMLDGPCQGGSDVLFSCEDRPLAEKQLATTERPEGTNLQLGLAVSCVDLPTGDRQIVRSQRRNLCLPMAAADGQMASFEGMYFLAANLGPGIAPACGNGPVKDRHMVGFVEPILGPDGDVQTFSERTGDCRPCLSLQQSSPGPHPGQVSSPEGLSLVGTTASSPLVLHATMGGSVGWGWVGSSLAESDSQSSNFDSGGREDLAADFTAEKNWAAAIAPEGQDAIAGKVGKEEALAGHHFSTNRYGDMDKISSKVNEGAPLDLMALYRVLALDHTGVRERRSLRKEWVPCNVDTLPDGENRRSADTHEITEQEKLTHERRSASNWPRFKCPRLGPTQQANLARNEFKHDQHQHREGIRSDYTGKLGAWVDHLTSSKSEPYRLATLLVAQASLVNRHFIPRENASSVGLKFPEIAKEYLLVHPHNKC